MIESNDAVLSPSQDINALSARLCWRWERWQDGARFFFRMKAAGPAGAVWYRN